MRWSIRARFALATSTAVFVVATGVAFAGYASLRHSLLTQARRTADGQARQLGASVEPAAGEAGAGQGNFVDITDPSLTSQLVRPGQWAATVDAQGRLLRRSAGGPKLISTALIASCRLNGTARATLARPPAEVACSRVGKPARGFVLAGAPIADTLRTLAATRHALIAAVIAGAIGSFALAWLLAAISLRPLQKIVSAARSIREGRLEQRIGYLHRDELGDVAAELDRSFAELESSLHRQQQFVMDASHELKTPLAAARANVQVLRRWAAEEPGAREEALAALERSTARMARVVSDLLHLARGDDRSSYASEVVSLDSVLLDAARDARTLRADVGITLEHLDEAAVRGDRDRILQLIGNLLDNAVRVTPPTGTVRAALVNDDGHAQLTVSDDGPGIDPSELAHIFDRFWRGSNGGGAGLGLAIARAIAHAHGGDIHARSSPGAGTTFTVDFALAEVSSDPHRALTAASSTSATVAATDEMEDRS
ncbi:MAG: HAMP domain-containing sensor histidine kinase [Gaiellaceae bacterium]